MPTHFDCGTGVKKDHVSPSLGKRRSVRCTGSYGPRFLLYEKGQPSPRKENPGRRGKGAVTDQTLLWNKWERRSRKVAAKNACCERIEGRKMSLNQQTFSPPILPTFQTSSEPRQRCDRNVTEKRRTTKRYISVLSMYSYI